LGWSAETLRHIADAGRVAFAPVLAVGHIGRAWRRCCRLLRRGRCGLAGCRGLPRPGGLPGSGRRSTRRPGRRWQLVQIDLLRRCHRLGLRLRLDLAGLRRAATQQAACLVGVFGLREHLVVGRDDRRGGRVVTISSTHPVLQGRHRHADQTETEQTHGQQVEQAHAGLQEPHQDGEHACPGRPLQEARQQHLAPGHAAGDPLDALQVGTHDGQGRHRELPVGKIIDGVRSVDVVVVDGDRPGSLQLDDFLRRLGWLLVHGHCDRPPLSSLSALPTPGRCGPSLRAAPGPPCIRPRRPSRRPPRSHRRRRRRVHRPRHRPPRCARRARSERRPG